MTDQRTWRMHRETNGLPHRPGAHCEVTHECDPILIINPQDRGQVRSVVELFVAGASEETISTWQRNLAFLVAPPEPEEPELLGSLIRADGQRYIKVMWPNGERRWRAIDAFTNARWRDLPRPITLGWDNA